MKINFVLSALFVSTAFAGFHAEQVPDLTPGNSSPRSKMLVRPRADVLWGKTCTDHTECAGVCTELSGCATGQEDYCNPAENKCRCAVQSPGAVCQCLLGDQYGPLQDSCKRGAPYGGQSWCVYRCGPGDVEAEGNASCNAQEDPCLLP